MKNTNARFLTMMLATLMGFRGKAPAAKNKAKKEKYPNGYNSGRPEARRRGQIEAGHLGYWMKDKDGLVTLYFPPVPGGLSTLSKPVYYPPKERN